MSEFVTCADFVFNVSNESMAVISYDPDLDMLLAVVQDSGA